MKTPVITGGPFLLEYCRTFPNLYTDQNTKLITIKPPSLNKNDKLPQNADDNFSSQISRMCLPSNLFYSAFDKLHEHSHAGLHIAQIFF